MTFEQFKLMIDRGEKATVDFKLVCNVFDKSCGDAERAKAELVKDLCAMANNGNVASYLIIGVGDDKNTVRTVNNPHLTSQNIQTLVRDSIHPRPNVKVHALTWPTAPQPFGGVKFIAIQIGPNGKHAFRLARDHIDWSNKIHFRKHEVWVRNEDTSDLATPEQITRLVAPRRLREPVGEPNFEVVDYQKLAIDEQLSALSKDVRKIFEEKGAVFDEIPVGYDLPWEKPRFRVGFKIRGKPFVFRCEFRTKLATQSEKNFTMQNVWGLENGVLVFVIKTFAEAGKFHRLHVDSKADWGSLNLVSTKWNAYFKAQLPKGFGDSSVSILTFSKLGNTSRLRDALACLFRDLETDDILFNHLNEARLLLNQEITRWSKKTFRILNKEFPDSFNAADRAAEFLESSKTVRAILKRISK